MVAGRGLSRSSAMAQARRARSARPQAMGCGRRKAGLQARSAPKAFSVLRPAGPGARKSSSRRWAGRR
eukprot:11207733-Lingulodinium_polyedra.AAC.1